MYNVLEVPLIVMDTTLKSNIYMNLSPEEGLSKIINLMHKVKKYNGIFTLLWHNTSFYSGGWAEWEHILEKAIENGIQNDFYFIDEDILLNHYFKNE